MSDRPKTAAGSISGGASGLSGAGEYRAPHAAYQAPHAAYRIFAQTEIYRFAKGKPFAVTVDEPSGGLSLQSNFGILSVGSGYECLSPRERWRQSRRRGSVGRWREGFPEVGLRTWGFRACSRRCFLWNEGERPAGATPHPPRIHSAPSPTGEGICGCGLA